MDQHFPLDRSLQTTGNHLKPLLEEMKPFLFVERLAEFFDIFTVACDKENDMEKD